MRARSVFRLASRSWLQRWALGAALGASATCGALSDAHAYRTAGDLEEFAGTERVRWEQPLIRYSVHGESPFGIVIDDALRLMEDSFRVWTEPQRGQVVFDLAGVTTSSADRRNPNTPSWAAGDGEGCCQLIVHGRAGPLESSNFSSGCARSLMGWANNRRVTADRHPCGRLDFNPRSSDLGSFTGGAGDTNVCVNCMHLMYDTPLAAVASGSVVDVTRCFPPLMITCRPFRTSTSSTHEITGSRCLELRW